MKETVKTSRTAGYLEKIFRALNTKYFGGQLEEPIITIQSTPRAYGHVTVARAWNRGNTTRHELNIGAGTLILPNTTWTESVKGNVEYRSPKIQARICRESPLILSGKGVILSRRTNGNLDEDGPVR